MGVIFSLKYGRCCSPYHVNFTLLNHLDNLIHQLLVLLKGCRTNKMQTEVQEYTATVLVVHFRSGDYTLEIVDQPLNVEVKVVLRVKGPV